MTSLTPMNPHEDRYVTNRDLSKELASFRWEVRFLIAAAGLANLGILYGVRPGLFTQAFAFVTGIFT